MNALQPRANGALFAEPNVISEDDGLRFGGRLRDHRLGRRITLDRAEHVSASERSVRFRQRPPKKAAKTTIDTEHAVVVDKPAWARSASLGSSSSSSDASSRDEIERSRDEQFESRPTVPLHDAPAEDDDKSLVGTDILTEPWEALLDMFDGGLAFCFEGDTGVEAVPAAYRKKSRRASLEELAGLAFVVSEEG